MSYIIMLSIISRIIVTRLNNRIAQRASLARPCISAAINDAAAARGGIDSVRFSGIIVAALLRAGASGKMAKAKRRYQRY